MRLILKLVLAQFAHHRLRTFLAVSAVITSVAMAVVIIGGETAVVIQPGASATKEIGSFDLVISAGSPSDVEADRKRAGANAPLPPFDDRVLQWLQKAPQVAHLTEECEMVAELRKLPASAMLQIPVLTPQLFKHAPAKPGDLSGTVASLTPGFIPPEPMPVIGIASAAPPRPVARGRWLNSTDTDAVVLDGDVARRIKYNVGQDLEVTTITGRQMVKIVGVLNTAIGIHGLTGIYAGPSLFARLAGQPMKANRVLIGLKEGASEQAFRGQLSNMLRASGQSAQIQNVKDLLDKLAASATPIASGAWAFPLLRDGAVKLAIVAAMFIIFNTFSMGVQERTRQLAMLRAIGMTRGQIVSMVLCEGVIIASVGWIAGMGIGWEILRRPGAIAGPAGLPIRLELDPFKLLALGAVVSFGAVLAATLIPAILASRKRPLEELWGPASPRLRAAPWWLGAIALLLIGQNLVAAYLPIAIDSNPIQPIVLMPLSYVGALIGFVLLIPSLLSLLEGVFVEIAARLLFLNPRLLQRQMSANLWRTVGCVSALMVGLGLYLFVHIWGHSMAVPFLITRCPDAVVIVSPGGVPADRLPDLKKLDGVTASLPLILEHPVLADLPSYVPVTGFDFFSKDMMLVGCDIPGLIDPHTGMFDGIFVRGNAKAAYQALGRGDSCLITDNLWRRVPEKYDVGKTITMTTDDIPHRTIRYTIAGVVEMDGWHQFSQRTRMRRNVGRSGGIVMVPVATAKAAYPQAMFQTLWFKLAADKDPSTLETPILRIVDGAASNMQSVGVKNSTYLQIINARALAGAQRVMIQRVIDSIGYYPLWALVLASAAVVNTIFASIRARSWEIGILRSIGLTRGQVVRHILAEGILIGLLACTASLLFAMLATQAGITAATRTMNVAAPYLIPWNKVGIGIAAALVLCVAASVFPALSLARREPLRLLQGGRTMM